MSTRAAGLSEVIESSPAEKDRLETLARSLKHVPSSTVHQLLGPDERAIELPPSLYEVLRVAVQSLLEGGAVTIAPLHRLLTTTEAGDVLGVSRQYLTRLLDNGQIPCSFTGRHRRIKLGDLLTYKRERDDARRRGLDEMTAMAAAAGAYD